MKQPSNITIERQDKNNLIIKVKPVIIYCFMILPIGLSLIFFLISLSVPYSINLSCDRYQSSIPSAINCQLIKRDLWGIRKQERKIVANNYESTIEQEYFKGSNITHYNLILLADNKRIEVSSFDELSPNYNLWQEQNKQIDKFLSTYSTVHLRVGENNLPTIIECFKLIATLIIICVIILGAKINLKYTLSKESNTLSILRYNSLIKISREINLDDIENVFLEEHKDIEWDTSRIVFQLKSKENISLASWTDSFDGKDKIFKRIRKFLG